MLPAVWDCNEPFKGVTGIDMDVEQQPADADAAAPKFGVADFAGDAGVVAETNAEPVFEFDLDLDSQAASAACTCRLKRAFCVRPIESSTARADLHGVDGADELALEHVDADTDADSLSAPSTNSSPAGVGSGAGSISGTATRSSRRASKRGCHALTFSRLSYVK